MYFARFARTSPLTLEANGSLSYTPDANYNGPDSFTYKAFDGGTNSNVTTVSITVDAVNDAPVALADAYSTAFRTTLTIDAATGVLQNDSDVDGNRITAELVAPTTHGMLTFNPDGSFSYVPDPRYFGQDSFVYHATDGAADSNDVTVQINNDVTVQINIAGAPALPDVEPPTPRWTMDGTTITDGAVLPNPGSDWYLV